MDDGVGTGVGHRAGRNAGARVWGRGGIGFLSGHGPGGIRGSGVAGAFGAGFLAGVGADGAAGGLGGGGRFAGGRGMGRVDAAGFLGASRAGHRRSLWAGGDYRRIASGGPRLGLVGAGDARVLQRFPFRAHGRGQAAAACRGGVSVSGGLDGAGGAGLRHGLWRSARLSRGRAGLAAHGAAHGERRDAVAFGVVDPLGPLGIVCRAATGGRPMDRGRRGERRAGVFDRELAGGGGGGMPRVGTGVVAAVGGRGFRSALGGAQRRAGAARRRRRRHVACLRRRRGY